MKLSSQCPLWAFALCMSHCHAWLTGTSPARQELDNHANGHEAPLGALSNHRTRKGTALDDVISSVKTMQGSFFEPWLGTWPDASDWTAAVHGTQLAAALRTISRSSSWQDCGDITFDSANENLINGGFSLYVAFYFGEDAIGLRNQAYDDMLWVVLDWLEGVQFIQEHSARHFEIGTANTSSIWYGKHFINGFAHRSRIFWELASEGWDTELCGGGMIWSRWVAPYKNAITNELFIAASIGMYLDYPGDDIDYPFASHQSAHERQASNPAQKPLSAADGMRAPGKPHDSKYLRAAQAAYGWLKSSNMTNAQGLFADGYHISTWSPENPFGKCDVRNEHAYTYNQGVLLTGQRGLWRATGDESYLTDGHALIRSAINATGWDLDHQRPPADSDADRWLWRGLGRAGVMEETCDASGTCDQNAQNFKGIYFDHLTTFCLPLPSGGPPDQHENAQIWGAREELRAQHQEQCAKYLPWVEHNARAAQATRDSEDNIYGMWWTHGLTKGDAAADASLLAAVAAAAAAEVAHQHEDSHDVDYRTNGTPDNTLWRGKGVATRERAGDRRPAPARRGRAQGILTNEAKWTNEVKASGAKASGAKASGAKASGVNASGVKTSVAGTGQMRRRDANDRGRGRTVETQSGGLAVSKALYTLLVEEQL